MTHLHAIATALLVVLAPGLAVAAEPAALATLPVAEALPLARVILLQSNITELPPAQLADNADNLLTRLMTNEELVAIDSPTDLHRLVALAVHVQLLERRGEPSAALRRAALSTAYALHLTGHAYETRPDVKATIDGLPEAVPGDRREVFEALVASVRGMRAYGKAWFPEALQAALADAPQSAEIHDQRGLFLAREGRHAEAAEAFAQAFRASERARYALNLFDALLRSDRLDDAAALEGRLRGAAPALSGRLEELRRSWEDERLTAAFDAKPRAQVPLEEQVAQAHRYLRVGREGAALVLVKELLAAHVERADVRHTAAEIYVATRRFGSFEELLAAAEQVGVLDDRLREARIAAAVQLETEHLQGGPDHPLAHVDVEGDLSALSDASSDRVALIRATIAVVRPLAKVQVALAGGAEAPPAALVTEVEAAIAAGLEALPSSGDMALMAVAAYSGVDKPLTGVELIRKRLSKIDAGARDKAAALVALIEAGYAVRGRDGARLARATKQLAAFGEVAPKGVDPAIWRYSRTILPLVEATIDGGSLTAEQARAALAALPRLELDLDLTAPSGRLVEGGLAASIGALLVVLDERDGAVSALKDFRRVSPTEPLARLAAGQAQLVHGDPVGAYEILSEALGVQVRSATAFAVQKWLALAANMGGDSKRGLGHMKTLLSLWDDAGAPRSVKERSPRPLFTGDFRVELWLEPGVPLAPSLRATPVLLLVPDFPHDRAEVEQLLERGQ